MLCWLKVNTSMARYLYFTLRILTWSPWSSNFSYVHQHHHIIKHLPLEWPKTEGLHDHKQRQQDLLCWKLSSFSIIGSTLSTRWMSSSMPYGLWHLQFQSSNVKLSEDLTLPLSQDQVAVAQCFIDLNIKSLLVICYYVLCRMS